MTRRALLGAAVAAGAVASMPARAANSSAPRKTVDVLLIGGGIMSSTLGVLLHELEPDWTMQMIERLDTVAAESSNGWNNAGTGHSALCELNYTPRDAQGNVHVDKALEINEMFQVSRQFWAHQVDQGVLKNPRSFITSTPHMSLVWGENVGYLEKRHEALASHPLFSGMRFSTDRAQIAQWAPLTMEGQPADRSFAANWSALGTDVNYGEVTRQYVRYLTSLPQFELHTSSEVRSIERNPDGSWRVSYRNVRGSEDARVVDARFVFIGAGGGSLPLLQASGIPEAADYAGFPVGGSFLATDNAQVAGRHLAKVYGQAEVGAPPMSVPHLDTRVLGGKRVLLFGPFATFSTKFLKNGSYFDLPESITLENIWPMLQVGATNFDLVTYLAGQLLMTREDHIAELRKFYPGARPEDWRMVEAGQRVQIIKRDPEKGGVLKLGTEIVSDKDRTIAALLGASPGASTAAPIMFKLLGQLFPERLATPRWQAKVRQIIPSHGLKLNEHPRLLAEQWARTSSALALAMAPPAVMQRAAGGAAKSASEPVKPVQERADLAI